MSASRISPTEWDRILVGGASWSAGWDTSRPWGVAIAGETIAAIAPDADLREAAPATAEVVDLDGALIVPAFHDAHAHPIAGAIEVLQCDLTEAVDAADALRRVAEYAASHPDVPWVLGGGWTMAHFPGGTPTRAQLDEIVPDRPVALYNRDHHGVWANTRAIEAAGLGRTTPDPEDGRLEREPDGYPAGTFHEGAATLITRVAAKPSPELARRALEWAQEEFFSLGIVGWNDAYVGATAGLDDVLTVYLDALAAGRLRSRVTAALWWERDGGLAQIAGLRERRARVEGLGRPDVLRADTVKIMVDGVAENYTAALTIPYRDACGHATDNSGLLFVDEADLHEAVQQLDDARFHLHFHALGDRAVKVALDALERAQGRNESWERHHHLAHLQMVQRTDVDRFAALGATANLQMLWGAMDDQLDELTFPFIDHGLVERHYPFRELAEAGAMLAAGSDWPVSSADPLAAVHVGVNRAAPGALPDPVMRPQQALGLDTALAAYTSGSARVNGRSESTGALKPGYFADLAILSRDLFAHPVEEIGDTTVRQTWLGGTQVWQSH